MKTTSCNGNAADDDDDDDTIGDPIELLQLAAPRTDNYAAAAADVGLNLLLGRRDSNQI